MNSEPPPTAALNEDKLTSMVLPLERPTPRRHVIAALALCLLWIALAWLGSAWHAANKENLALEKGHKDLSEDISDMALGLQQSLALYHGIPATIGRDTAIHQALSALPQNLPQSSLSKQENQRRWQQDPVFSALNRSLLASSRDIPAFSVIWLMNPAGDCIASSNAESKESFVGTNYADRAYFQDARRGSLGNQFAVGRMTGIPGLFFSAPIQEGQRFLGVLAVKIDLPFLTSWINQVGVNKVSFLIADAYGVIIAAQQEQFLMQALPGASVHGMSKTQRSNRYRRDQFTELRATPWGTPAYPELKRLNDNPTAILMASKAIPAENLTVVGLRPMPELDRRLSSQLTLFTASASSGLIAITLLTALSYFLGNRTRVQRYQEQQAHATYLAIHDTLTGLYSRAVLDQLIPQGIAISERTGRRLAVLFLDLDLFKNVNDAMGHEVGDEVLREVATRLRASVRASDTVIRQGGDEFIILLNDLDTVENAAAIAGNLIEAVGQPYLIQGVHLKLSASVGIAMYPEDGNSASVLLRNADSALYYVKANGRADYHFYHCSMNASVLEHLALENALSEAIASDQLILHYHPQYALETRSIIGCEALVRWRHPDKGLLYPDKFIPIAEKSGLIIELDEWVLSAACHQAQKWRQHAGLTLQVSVNVSAVHFRKPGLVERVRNALAESGLPPALLELELTESAVMDNVVCAMETLNELKAIGVRIAIDDFGTGYSSLAYLKRFNVDVLKIDGVFVRELESSPGDRAIVCAIIQLAKSLDCSVVAEWVETQGQVQLLQQLGCDVVQGYWLAQPLPPDDLLQLLRKIG